MKYLTLAAILAILLLAPQAHAGQAYAGVSLGRASLEASPTDIDFDIDFDFNGDDSGFKVFGGYRFKRFLALEGSYFDLGSIDDTVLGFSFLADVRGVDACAVARLSTGRWFEFFGRAGLAYWDVEATVIDDETDQRITRGSTDSGWTFGVGGAVRINRHIAVRVEWQVYELEQSDSVSLASLGLEIGF